MAAAASASDRVEIGGVARAHGIKGEVVVVTHDPESDTLAGIAEIFLAGVAYEVIEARDTPKGWLVALRGVETRNDAERLQGAVVEVARDALGLGEDDVLLSDLIGCAVETVGGAAWGVIAAIDHNGAQDLLVIEAGEVERLLPLIDEFVVSIDVAGKKVVVDPPEGLPENKVVRRGGA